MRQPRVWNVGDREPLGNPMVFDRHGRLWRWDPNLVFWIHESAGGDIEASCPNWQSLTLNHGPLTER
jgi:hypothetical protein